MREVNVRKRKSKPVAIVQTVTSPEELRERLSSQQAASIAKLGTRLLELSLITPEQLNYALRVQRDNASRHLGKVLIELGYVTESQLAQIVCEQLGIPLVEIQRFPIDPPLLTLLPEKSARLYNMLPLCSIDGQLFLAMSDPLDAEAIEHARFTTQMAVVPVMALRDDLDDAMRAHFDHAAVPFFVVERPPRPARKPEQRPAYRGLEAPPPPPKHVPTSAAAQVAVVDTIVSPEQLRERLRTQHHAAMLKLGVRLVQLKLITREQLETALHAQRGDSVRHLGQVLFDLGFISEPHLKQVVCDQLGIALVDLRKFPIDRGVLRLLPEKSAREYYMLPLCCLEAQLVVAMADPLNVEAIEHARFCAEMAVLPVMGIRYELEQAIRSLYDTVPYAAGAQRQQRDPRVSGAFA